MQSSVENMQFSTEATIIFDGLIALIMVRDGQLEAVHRLIDAQQAKIDRLMFEYCPDDMTEEQKETWGQHQVPVATP
jgi:hypothetical protein